MTVADILQQRLLNQNLPVSSASTPVEAVSRLLAVQAQDYLGSLWAIGQRVDGSTEKSIEESLDNGSLIRTWPMRGTLHMVAAEDARWLVGLLAARALAKARGVHKNVGLDTKIFRKSTQVVTKVLEKDSRLTRDELYAALERARISTDNSRGLHITGYLALHGLICFGPRQGKQQTFVLMDDWLKTSKSLLPDELMPTLALRYFGGHGPATDMDFAWWSGLTLTEARQAIAMAGNALTSETYEEDRYYFADTHDSNPVLSSKVKSEVHHLLPAYDEFTVAYKNRALVLPRSYRPKGAMEVLSPTIVVNGTVVGTWTRALSKKGVVVRLKPFSKLSAANLSKIKKQAQRYATFLGLDKASVETIS